MMPVDDIIAAIATPIGEGGIGVIRGSGKGVIEIVDRCFRGSVRLAESQSQMAHVGYFFDGNGSMVDEIVVTVYRGPRSYTGEDVVEISCHGGLYVTRKVLEAVIVSGARLAEPGEFTKRAFLSGRIDLSQAEAVADLIKARSQLAHRTSLEQLRGSLSSAIQLNLDRLVHACGLVELELDFIEEGITLTSQSSLRGELEVVLSDLKRLAGSFEYGRLCREGIKVVLVGRPNVGKSSLLNKLLDRDRAIVTEIPGTTRDVIEENVIINGMLYKLVDTAGIRQTDDIVEKEGVRRSRQELETADICAYVVDLTRKDWQEDQEFIESVRGLHHKDRPLEILVENKSDLPPLTIYDTLARNLNIPRLHAYRVSALTGEGIGRLKTGLGNRSDKMLNHADGSAMITNTRHKARLQEAIGFLEVAIEGVSASAGGEVVAIDLREAVNALGAIVGKVATEDILNAIFSEFCIGK